MGSPRYLVSGDEAVVVEFGDTIDPTLNRLARRFAQLLLESDAPGIVEVLPTYRSVLVQYDNLVHDWRSVVDLLEHIVSIEEPPKSEQTRLISVPTRYGGEMGPDLQTVAAHTGLDQNEVIARHSAPEYLVYMLGFTPGFPYLGGLDPLLSTPRLETPRLKTPRGAVGIGGDQTGIYSVEAPGGFNVIGRTPLNLFDPHRTQPFLLRAGDLIRFDPIDEIQYARIENECSKPDFDPKERYVTPIR